MSVVASLVHPDRAMIFLATERDEQNRAAVDPWTAVHFSAGLALGLIAVPLPWAAAASIAYELGEQVFERHPWGRRFFDTRGPESVPNALMDVVALVGGHRLGRLWNRKA